MESISPSLESIGHQHAENVLLESRKEVPLSHESTYSNFWKERLECAEMFVWMVGAGGSIGALIWTVGAIINRVRP